MSSIDAVPLIAYLVLLAALSLIGAHRLHLAGLFLRGERRPARTERPPLDEAALPAVTVQLPIYNERYVVRRLIDAAAALDYPRDRLQIQILDDSTDDTTALARDAARRWRAAGVDMVLLRRGDRVGFKAGALEAGMASAKGELIAIFDADFIPPRDFLRRVLPWFDDGVGMVQTRWGHLNADYSLLTDLQSLLLDGHFVVEHGGRFAAGRFFNFNGTAGVWRRRCIEDAGGWQHDTLTEDLDLSYRAQLNGWRFVYRPEIVSPAELPVTMGAFKNQQRRWAKGSIQTARKLLPAILRAELPLMVKLEGAAHLTANLAYPMMLLLSLLVPLSPWWRGALDARGMGVVDALAFSLSSLSVGIFYLVAARAISPDWRRRSASIPAVMALGVGIGVSQTWAVIEALAGRSSPFVRTPKSGAVRRVDRWRRRAYPSGVDWTAGMELALTFYQAFGVLLSLQLGDYLALPFQLLFLFGFGYVGLGSMLGERAFTGGAAEATPSQPDWGRREEIAAPGERAK